MNRPEESSAPHQPVARPSGRSRLASAMILCGTMATVVILLPKLRNAVPMAWFQNAIPLWMMISLAVLGTGFWLLNQLTEEERQARGPRPRRFRSGVLYTRQDCPLCDEAYALLLEYEDELPPLQIVDIDTNPDLIERYGTWVPVLEIDGRERFRGHISEVLLRRLLRNTDALASDADSHDE